jgi:hypothetical protein
LKEIGSNQIWGVLGITDDPRPPIVCKAKIGEKGDRGQPRRLDFIVFVEPQTGRRISEFQEVFGERPTEFKALLAGDRLEDNIDVSWKRYGKLGLKCRGNGMRGVDRETGEERECAGPYNFADQAKHHCPFARPTQKGDKVSSPECKPVLSMRLVVPQIPGLGVVQIDTGGVASSIQTLVWQLRMIERQTQGHMAGIAVSMSIRAFPDKFGNAAYSWQITPVRSDEAEELRGNVECLTRIEGQIPKELPQIAEQVDPDVYGLPAPSDEGEEAGAVGERVTPMVWMAKVATAEGVLFGALDSAGVPQAKIDSYKRKVKKARDHAADNDLWAEYIDWLTSETERLEAYAEEGAGQGALV